MVHALLENYVQSKRNYDPEYVKYRFFKTMFDFKDVFVYFCTINSFINVEAPLNAKAGS